MIMLPNSREIVKYLDSDSENKSVNSIKHEAYTKILSNIPFTIPFDLRVLVFRHYTQEPAYSYQHASIKIRRDHLFEDGFAQLKGGELLKGSVRIIYYDSQGMQEAGIDGGGISGHNTHF